MLTAKRLTLVFRMFRICHMCLSNKWLAESLANKHGPRIADQVSSHQVIPMCPDHGEQNPLEKMLRYVYEWKYVLCVVSVIVSYRSQHHQACYWLRRQENSFLNVSQSNSSHYEEYNIRQEDHDGRSMTVPYKLSFNICNEVRDHHE